MGSNGETVFHKCLVSRSAHHEIRLFLATAAKLGAAEVMHACADAAQMRDFPRAIAELIQSFLPVPFVNELSSGKYDGGVTPLMQAAKLYWVGRYLRNTKGVFERKCERNQSHLNSGYYVDARGLFEQLIQAGADPNVRNPRNGRTALMETVDLPDHERCERDPLPLAKLLIKSGADPNLTVERASPYTHRTYYDTALDLVKRCGRTGIDANLIAYLESV